MEILGKLIPLQARYEIIQDGLDLFGENFDSLLSPSQPLLSGALDTGCQANHQDLASRHPKWTRLKT